MGREFFKLIQADHFRVWNRQIENSLDDGYVVKHINTFMGRNHRVFYIAIMEDWKPRQ